jgi:hypothetical protein
VKRLRISEKTLKIMFGTKGVEVTGGRRKLHNERLFSNGYRGLYPRE